MSDHEDIRLPDGRTLQVWQGGDSAGVPVVFLPGCPDSRRAAFSGEASAAEAGVRLIAVNRPGYGRSTATASDHLSVADDVMAVADRLGIEQLSVLGMSIGGPYAVACAARHPQRVRAVGAVAAPAMPTELDPPFVRDGLDDSEQQLLRRIAAATADDAAEIVRPGYLSWVVGIAPDDPDDEALAQRWLAAMSPGDRRTLSSYPVDVLAASAREALVQPDGYLRDVATTFRPWAFDPADVACPVLLWYGANDPNVSRRNADWWAARLPDARVAVLPDATHLQSLVDNWPTVLGSLATVQGPG